MVSNRLPASASPRVEGGRDGEMWDPYSPEGSLVAAVAPVFRRRGGVWTGWPGVLDTADDELSGMLRPTADDALPCALQPVSRASSQEELFQRGFCDRVVWPLFHGLSGGEKPEPEYWAGYAEVNREFARSVASSARWDDLIWVHGHHLMLVGKELRTLGLAHRLAFFLHIPFPPLSTLRRMPWHREVVDALLHFDLLGFQTHRSRNNFVEAARALVPEAFEEQPSAGHPILHGRVIRTEAFPVGIDYAGVVASAQSPVVGAMEQEARRGLGNRTLFLGVDPMAHTGGIPEKLRGLELALERYPELRDRVVLDQLLIRSRDRSRESEKLRGQIEEQAGSINRRWGHDGWDPVRVHCGLWSQRELMARYRAGDAALLTPLSHGMNLVAKQFVAANERSGLLILSASDGAAAELGGSALLVNPSDPDSVAAAVVHAHEMPARERKGRMSRAREQVRAYHAHRWATRFLAEGVRAG